MFSASQESFLTSGETRYYGIRTLDYPLQFGFEFSFESEATLTFFKDSTNSGGSNLLSRNINGTSSETMGAIVFNGSTVSVEGTVWAKQQWADNTGPLNGTTNIGGRIEGYILKANSSYTFKLEEESAATNNFTITCGYFNHV